jgi:maltose alpha-D-glucosyltransferase/alpha-amylase
VADGEEATRLGELTGRLHMALASAPAGMPIAPAPIEPSDLSAWQAGMQAHLDRVMGALAGALDSLPAPVRDMARPILADVPCLRDGLSALRALGTERVMKIRVHGDYHLGQVVRTEDSFRILDFEGEPSRPLAERRAKQCALKDVAGMLRSFAYAAQAAWLSATDAAPELPDLGARLAPGAERWEQGVRGAFLDGYLAETLARGAPFLPRRRETFDAVLRVFELDKAIYEVRYELDHRPAWLRIPLEGLRRGGQP